MVSLPAAASSTRIELPPAAAVRIRPIEPTDDAALRAFYGELCDESRRTRFLGPVSGIGASLSTRFCAPEHAHAAGFVAVASSAREEDRIVGHLCVELDGPTTAELAVAVADGMQGHGIGRSLVGVAVAWAREAGLATLTATMLAANPAIQRLLTDLGVPSVAVPIGAGVIEVGIDLCAAPVAA